MKHLGAFSEVLSKIISAMGGYESEWARVEAERRPQPSPVYPGGSLDLLLVPKCFYDVSFSINIKRPVPVAFCLIPEDHICRFR
jgi:hypothetical protein